MHLLAVSLKNAAEPRREFHDDILALPIQDSPKILARVGWAVIWSLPRSCCHPSCLFLGPSTCQAAARRSTRSRTPENTAVRIGSTRDRTCIIAVEFRRIRSAHFSQTSQSVRQRGSIGADCCHPNVAPEIGSSVSRACAGLLYAAHAYTHAVQGGTAGFVAGALTPSHDNQPCPSSSDGVVQKI